MDLCEEDEADNVDEDGCDTYELPEACVEFIVFGKQRPRDTQRRRSERRAGREGGAQSGCCPECVRNDRIDADDRDGPE